MECTSCVVDRNGQTTSGVERYACKHCGRQFVVHTPELNSRKGNSVQLEGESYPSLIAACRAGCEKYKLVSPTVAAARVGRGWSLETAITTPILSKKAGLVYYLFHPLLKMGYVGITRAGGFEQRMAEHVAYAHKLDNPNEGTLQWAIRHYGLETFEKRILSELTEDAPALERESISKLGTRFPNGFNQADGGEIGAGRANAIYFEGKRYRNIAVLAQSFGFKTRAEYVYFTKHLGPIPCPDDEIIAARDAVIASRHARAFQLERLHGSASQSGGEPVPPTEQRKQTGEEATLSTNIPIQNGAYLTVADLTKRWGGIVTQRTMYSWAKYPHRGPKRAEEVRPFLAFSLQSIEEYERTNARLRLALNRS